MKIKAKNELLDILTRKLKRNFEKRNSLLRSIEPERIKIENDIYEIEHEIWNQVGMKCSTGLNDISDDLSIEIKIARSYNQARLDIIHANYDFTIWPFKKTWRVMPFQLKKIQDNYPDQYRKIFSAISEIQKPPIFHVKSSNKKPKLRRIK